MKDATLVTVAGRNPEQQHGVVNPPVYHASTILFPSVAEMEAARPRQGNYYGRYGTPTTFALEEALAALEGGDRSIVVGSGKTAINAMLLALLQAGDHVLVADTVYAPTRAFCSGLLSRYGVSITYFDPALGAGIAALIRPETKLVFTEARDR